MHFKLLIYIFCSEIYFFGIWKTKNHQSVRSVIFVIKKYFYCIAWLYRRSAQKCLI